MCLPSHNVDPNPKFGVVIAKTATCSLCKPADTTKHGTNLSAPVKNPPKMRLPRLYSDLNPQFGVVIRKTVMCTL